MKFELQSREVAKFFFFFRFFENLNFVARYKMEEYNNMIRTLLSALPKGYKMEKYNDMNRTMINSLAKGHGMNVTRLRALAKRYGVKGYSRRSKDHLIIVLREIAKHQVARFEFDRINVVQLEPTKFDFKSYEDLALVFTYFRDNFEVLSSEVSSFGMRV